MGGASAMAYTSEDVMAATFNLELIENMGDAVAPLLLVVEGKVLGEHVHTPILDGGHLHGGYPARQPAVLGVVLELNASMFAETEADDPSWNDLVSQIPYSEMTNLIYNGL